MSSMFGGFGDWLRGSPGGAGGGAPMGGGMGGGTRGGMIGQTIQGMANPTNNLVQQQQQQGSKEEELWAMLQRLIAQRGMPGQGGQQGRISGPPGQAPGGVPPMGGLY